MRILLAVLSSIFLLSASIPVLASETDQYTYREVPIADSREAVNRHVNEAIERAVKSWDEKRRDDFEFAQHVRWEIEGFLNIRRTYVWAKNNPEIAHLATKDASVYKSVPYSASTIKLFGKIGETISINGVRLGLDKLSHTFSIGWRYFKLYKKYGVEGAVLRGGGTEKGFLGWYTTGVYSNADIVANYEGHLFYRSLTEEGVIGKPSIVRWEAGRPVIQRKFDFADHVTPYYDETINNSHLRKGVAKYVFPKLKTFCPQYFANPALWAIDPSLDEKLERRYEILGLWGHKQYRLENVCSDHFGGGDGS